MAYRTHEIQRIVRVGFETAMKRNKRLCSVDKANVLDSSKLWRKIVNEMAADYPEVEVRHMYVDNCAMQIVRDPSQFDVIVTENLFGDILSDEASQITGSIGLLPAPRSARRSAACTSRFTAPRRTSPVRTARTPSPPSSPPR